MPTTPKIGWSGIPIDTLIDREFGRNPEIRNGISAYAGMLADWEQTGDGAALLDALLDLAAANYRKAGQQDAKFYVFSDGAANFLLDIVRERVVLVWGEGRPAAPNSRDNAYHSGFPAAGADHDKGHAWSHAQGGREGGPNYFRQARRLNQARSNNGKLWRAIETYMAANAGISAFVRLVYEKNYKDDRPSDVEYGILSETGQFRVVLFPNH